MDLLPWGAISQHIVHPTSEGVLTREIIAVAREYRRYAYRRITALLPVRGWLIMLSFAGGELRPGSHRRLPLPRSPSAI